MRVVSGFLTDNGRKLILRFGKDQLQPTCPVTLGLPAQSGLRMGSPWVFCEHFVLIGAQNPCPKELMLRNHVWDQRRTDGMVCMVVENPPGGYPPNPPGGYPPNPPDGRYVWGLFCV
jgi:hypothetical protein